MARQGLTKLQHKTLTHSGTSITDVLTQPAWRSEVGGEEDNIIWNANARKRANRPNRSSHQARDTDSVSRSGHIWGIARDPSLSTRDTGPVLADYVPPTFR